MMELRNSSEQMSLQTRQIYLKAYLSGSESPSDEGSDFDETFGMTPVEKPHRFVDMVSDYLSILKSARFLKIARQSASTAALGVISDTDITNPMNLPALCDRDTLEMLVNLCEVKETSCVSGALKVVRQLTKIHKVAVAVVNLGIVPTCVELLPSNALDIMEDASAIIGNVGYLRRAEKACRRTGGIQFLVSLLNIKKDILVLPYESLTDVERRKIAVTTSAANALWVLAKFSKNKMMMMKSGIVQIISEILRSGNQDVSGPVSGILSECSKIFLFQDAIEREGLVGVLLDNISNGDVDLQWSSACSLMRAAGGSEIVREMIAFHDGLKVIADLVAHGDRKDKRLMAAAIGAMWKVAISQKNAEQFGKLGAIRLLEPFILDIDMDVRISTVGAMAELSKSEGSRTSIVKGNIIPRIVYMLQHAELELMASAAQCLGELALVPEGMKIIEDNDGVRLVWSLLSNKDVELKIKALWAIKPMVTRASDPGEVIRQITGSLELLNHMLNNKDVRLLTAVVAVVGEVALDLENLSVMTEQGLVRHLSRLTKINDNALRRELCSAICHCCNLHGNVRAFGRIIPVMTQYLATKDQTLLRQVCRLLHAMSRDPMNCVLLHSSNAVPYLLCATESSDRATYMSAAGCLTNIRHVLLKADAKKGLTICSKLYGKKTGECDPQGPSVFS